MDRAQRKNESIIIIKKYCHIFFREFQSMMSTSNDNSSYQTKTLIGFGSRQRLNPISLIQLSETLLIKLTRTHKNIIILKYVIKLK